MSIVIVGGHDRMVGQYKKICKSYKCKCKVFTQMEADFGKKIGCPDLLVLFTNTVSHKMVKCALDEVGASTDIVRCHKMCIRDRCYRRCYRSSSPPPDSGSQQRNHA